MTMSESVRAATCTSEHVSSLVAQQDLEMCREVAERFVEDIISKATQEVAHTKTKKLILERQGTMTNPPEILFDLVGPRSPTPEEETFPWVTNAADGETDVDQKTEDDPSPPITHQPARQETHATAIELNSFALTYVKDIIAKATSLAAERAAARASLESLKERDWKESAPVICSQPKTGTTVSAQGASTIHRVESGEPHDVPPTAWYLRLGQVARRLMRSTCLCKGGEGRRQEPEQTFL